MMEVHASGMAFARGPAKKWIPKTQQQAVLDLEDFVVDPEEQSYSISESAGCQGCEPAACYESAEYESDAFFMSCVTLPSSKSNELQVKLSNQELGDAGVARIAGQLDSALRATSSSAPAGVSSNIELDRNRMGDAGLKALLSVLRKYGISIWRICIYRNNLTDLGAELLASVLGWQMMNCYEVHFSHNHLSAKGLVALCMAVSQGVEATQPCWVRLEHNCIARPLAALSILRRHGQVMTCMAKDRNLCTIAHCGIASRWQKPKPNVHLLMLEIQRSDVVQVENSELIEDIEWWTSHLDYYGQDAEEPTDGQDTSSQVPRSAHKPGDSSQPSEKKRGKKGTRKQPDEQETTPETITETSKSIGHPPAERSEERNVSVEPDEDSNRAHLKELVVDLTQEETVEEVAFNGQRKQANANTSGKKVKGRGEMRYQHKEKPHGQPQGQQLENEVKKAEEQPSSRKTSKQNSPLNSIADPPVPPPVLEASSPPIPPPPLEERSEARSPILAAVLAPVLADSTELPPPPPPPAQAPNTKETASRAQSKEVSPDAEMEALAAELKRATNVCANIIKQQQSSMVYQ